MSLTHSANLDVNASL